MSSKFVNQQTQPPDSVMEISRFIAAYALSMIGIGLVITIMGLGTRDLSRNDFVTYLGIAFLCIGILLGFLARKFRQLRPWTFSTVSFLISSAWGLRGADMFDLPRKIRSAEARHAFGLEPLPDYAENKTNAHS